MSVAVGCPHGAVGRYVETIGVISPTKSIEYDCFVEGLVVICVLSERNYSDIVAPYGAGSAVLIAEIPNNSPSGLKGEGRE